MKQIELVIQNPTGLHARPAKVLVTLAKQFKADIGITCGAKRVNAKSMVSVLTLGATKGTCITVQADGEDEEMAIMKLDEAIRSGLGDNDLPEMPKPVTAPVTPKVEAPVEVPPTAPGVIKGIGAAPGIAVGPIFHYKQVELDLNNLDAFSSADQMGVSESLKKAKEQLSDLH